MTASIVLALSLCPCAVSQHKDGHYLYLSMPDGAQQEGRSGAGILVFDIDNGHKFVRRIEIPIFNEGLRGFAGHLGNHAAYYSTTNHRVGAFDLETEQILWEKTYDQGADRSAVSADGAKLYVPTGWWYSGEDSGLLVLNARNGDLIKKIPVGPQAHNSIVGLRGDRLYLGTRTMLRARNKITYAECACRLGCRE
jgi:outer membrane protein assembly factor BamB